MQSVTYLVSVYCLFCMCSKTCVKLEYMCNTLIAVITQNNMNKNYDFIQLHLNVFLKGTIPKLNSKYYDAFWRKILKKKTKSPGMKNLLVIYFVYLVIISLLSD